MTDTDRVVLVNMPFAGFRQPSAALGLLKACLAPHDEPVHRRPPTPLFVLVREETLRFAEAVSPQTYDLIATWQVEDLLGDWLFSHALSQGAGSSLQDYAAAVLAGGLPEHQIPYFGKPPVDVDLLARLTTASERVPAFLDACCQDITSQRPLLVGFTCMFHQLAASLALAERLKAALPDTFVLFGGAACRGDMGAQLLQSFPSIDGVCSGDGEMVLPAAVDALRAARPLDDIPGLLLGERAAAAGAHTGAATPYEQSAAVQTLAETPGEASAESAPGEASAESAPGEASAESAPGEASAESAPGPQRAWVERLDDLPYPDYSDYVAQLAQSPLSGSFVPRIPFEASRGCRWGQRQRCTFCGQASDVLAYRTKSVERMADELEALRQRHPGSPVLFTDELVPTSFIDEVAPRLSETSPEQQVIYFETRADLTKERLTVLAGAGIRRLEVGIESLSTPMLRLMRKGTTALQGIQVLKWARQLGVAVVWNFLWGFPDEDLAEYTRMARLVPLLTHLQPPHAVGPVRLDRFSPLFEERERLGIADARPYPAYSYVYGLPEADLSRLAYHFAFAPREGRVLDAGTVALAEEIGRWKNSYPSSLLWSLDDGERLLLSDSRPGFDSAELTVLDADHRQLYLACDRARSAAGLARQLSADGERDVSVDDVHALLEPLVEQGSMLRDGDAYLSLALQAPEHLVQESMRPAQSAEPGDPQTATG